MTALTIRLIVAIFSLLCLHFTPTFSFCNSYYCQTKAPIFATRTINLRPNASPHRTLVIISTIILRNNNNNNNNDNDNDNDNNDDDEEDPDMLHEEEEDENDLQEEDDDDDDDETTIKPYRNRSLAWTKRYRKLNPYETCRGRVLQFGHRSKEDWDEAVESGQLGAYVPSYPDEMYAPEWVSWDDWLGLMRSYEETRQMAISVLGCKSLDDYILFVRSNPKRAEGLRIPVRPDLFFKDKWKSEEDFFGAPLNLGNSKSMNE
ncbi:unnamed protein product [Cylindrotheca closterium]|uniref:Uncharacterized protein n=1 Tax=Cylindrotheca closterium TaxID=2856 RepID=A0AAD2FUU6_9STRA|nr:unnamed protein product [Cylindrotheca closterium]